MTGATTALSSPPAASSSAAPALKANLYVRSVLADKPYAYWRLTDRAGRLAADVMRRATGTILGAVSRGEGPILDGGSFGFGRGHVRAKAPANFLPDTWSIEAWVKQDFQPRDGAIFSFSGGPQRPVKGSGAMLATAGGQQIYLAFQTRNHRIYLVTPATPPFFERLKRGVWHHFVGTRGRQTMRLYVDGVLLRSAKSSTDPGTVYGDTPTFGIGDVASQPGIPLKGAISEVAFYNYALSSQQVKKHWQASVPCRADTGRPTTNCR